ncbi:hypothetical protein SOMG_00928 [Schizosaccharomyces osmophilus]|uniref:Uncharacterized protein n=1 Tax=Schizosaccharomyces osmophilus TaxID=2545709 RepID=A0AAF0AVE0_9SCHI|nr:uncharacterized protein SOMG_00928 [Schizosaccharomyces osmophilus]WBW72437.1 hypothetical protein SOMG_00928 [Schizosaccharomyces osmophilus]
MRNAPQCVSSALPTVPYYTLAIVGSPRFSIVHTVHTVCEYSIQTKFSRKMQEKKKAHKN